MFPHGRIMLIWKLTGGLMLWFDKETKTVMRRLPVSVTPFTAGSLFDQPLAMEYHRPCTGSRGGAALGATCTSPVAMVNDVGEAPGWLGLIPQSVPVCSINPRCRYSPSSHR